MTPVIVVGEEEAERADLVVCVRKAEFDPAIFPDNLEAPCHDCGRTVVFRPTAPKTPIKICWQCAKDRTEGGRG